MAEHLINTRILTTYKPLNEELTLQSQNNYLFDLSYLGVMDVKGEKALDFLQGQLTCDVYSVSNTHIAQGAQCTLKGRILTLMDILSWQGVKLVLPKDLMEATAHSLNKTAMLSRVSLQKHTQLTVLGFYLQNPKDIIPDNSIIPTALYDLSFSDHFCCYHLGASLFIFLGDLQWANRLKKQFMEKNQLVGSLGWHTLRLKQLQIEIYPESRALFLPHRLGLHQTPYLSFNKGCYKGQEIIARMHYKATLKHEMKLFIIKTDEKIHSGQKLLKEPGGAEIGELIDFSLLGKDHYLIAVSILNDAPLGVFFEGHRTSVILELC
jgi:folate-binding protein YgfZ